MATLWRMLNSGMAICTIAATSALGARDAAGDKGRWTTKESIGSIAVHAALLPGNGSPHHSTVVWWRNFGEGAVWGWQPGNDSCMASTTTGFTSLGAWTPGHDIFCSAHAHLGSGDLMTFGGNEDPTAFGILDARRFNAGTGTWVAAPKMAHQRWYPSATTLSGAGTNGGSRVLVTSGSMFQHLWLFGGRRNGGNPAIPTGDSLQRFGAVFEGDRVAGQWDPPVRPVDHAGLRPDVREGHSAAFLSVVQQEVYFGGKNGAGALKNDTWFLSASSGDVTSAAESYQWVLRPISDGPPLSRARHTAVAISNYEMIVFGGIGESGLFDDVWRLWRNAFTEAWTWSTVTTSGDPPAARYGHTAIWDAPTRRMMVYGGAIGSPNAEATDEKIWILTFNPTDGSSGTWTSVAANTSLGQPGTRAGHTMVLNPTEVTEGGETGRPAIMFGGEVRGGTHPDTLWVLWIKPTELKWKPHFLPDPSGFKPVGRARHVAVLEGLTPRLVIHGGEVANGTPADDGYFYSTIPFGSSDWWRKWRRWNAPGFQLAGHTISPDIQLGSRLARIPEVFDSGTNQWTAEPAAALLQKLYPLNFLIPGGSSAGGRVITVGSVPASRTYTLDIPAAGQPLPAWQERTNLDAGFSPFTGVQYRPGKIMITGGTAGGAVVGTTKKTDTSNPSTAQWTTSSSMDPRFYHNLVVLPNGEVLVTGGVGTTSLTANSPAKKRPQIWSPDGGGGAGSWTSLTDTATRLAESGAVRGYHSTAILLPDGRVLCAGGNEYVDVDQKLGDVFCPPYLFNSAGFFAERPELTGAPQRVRYGQQISICSPYSTNAVSPSLIRPASTTHGFDQDQRYVPLTFEPADYGSRLIATIPSDSSIAPPGDYLLFILGTNGTPGIARWVRLGSSWDAADNTSPAAIPDFGPEVLSSTKIILTWTVPGDDGGSGIASQYELKYSTSPIDTSQIHLVASVPQLPIPGCSGELQSYELSGLQSNTWYYFSIRTSDEKGNLSAFRLCQGKTTIGGGGGSSAVESRFDPMGAHARPLAAATESQALSAGPSNQGILVLERADVGSVRRWVARRSSGEGLAGLGNADTGAVLLQSSEPGLGWRTYSQGGTSSGALGVLSARPGARIVFPGGASVARVARAMSGYSFESCLHSRLGPQYGDPQTGEFAVALEVGDSLVLTYTPNSEAQADLGECAFLINVDRQTRAYSGRQAKVAEPGSSGAPAEFRLHPAQPNPFGGGTVLQFDVPQVAMVKFEIFDLMGRRVHLLANQRFDPGRHRLEWDGRGASGRRVEAGIYYARFEAGYFRDQVKLIVVP